MLVKMKTYPLICLIILSLIVASMPGFIVEDATMDSRIDLADAVSHMKNLTKNAENTGQFSADYSKTVSTFKRLVGINTQIENQTNDSNLNNTSGLFTLSSKNLVPVLNSFIVKNQMKESCNSEFEKPSIPPPENQPHFS